MNVCFSVYTHPVNSGCVCVHRLEIKVQHYHLQLTFIYPFPRDELIEQTAFQKLAKLPKMHCTATRARYPRCH